MMFTYSIEEKESAVHVFLSGDLDIEATELIEEELIPHLQAYHEIFFRFDEVPFVDSTGIGLLIQMVQTFQEKGKLVRIMNLKEEIEEIFDLLEIGAILGRDVIVA